MKSKLLLFFSVITSLVFSQTVIDIDGNIYKTVTIGTQEWMADNLRTTKYNDGAAIDLVTDSSAWANLFTNPGYCYYENDKSKYDSLYGGLYNWYAANSGKVCPSGWHLPSRAEWMTLGRYLDENGHTGIRGKALKSITGWDDYNGSDGNGTDNYGFNGLPAGVRSDNGNFYLEGIKGYWWSSTEVIPVPGQLCYTCSYNLILLNEQIEYDSFILGYDYQRQGKSVRCLNDNLVTGTNKLVKESAAISVYPNPTQGTLKVELNNSLNNTGVIIKVLNTQSAELYNEIATGSSQTIDVSSWAAGIYFVHILDSSKTINVIKIIVNK